MKTSKIFIGALVALFLCLSGCSAIQTLGDYVNENPVFANIAARQAVAAYIAKGDTLEEQAERAEQVNRRINKALIFLDGNPEATVDSLLEVVDSSIDWDELNPQDRMLVEDILALVEDRLKEYEVENSPIKEATAIAVKTLLETAGHASKLYLAK